MCVVYDFVHKRLFLVWQNFPEPTASFDVMYGMCAIVYFLAHFLVRTKYHFCTSVRFAQASCACEYLNWENFRHQIYRLFILENQCADSWESAFSEIIVTALNAASFVPVICNTHWWGNVYAPLVEKFCCCPSICMLTVNLISWQHWKIIILCGCFVMSFCSLYCLRSYLSW